MNANIAFLAPDSAVRQKYAERIQRLGADATLFSSFGDLYSDLKTTPYNGLIVDVLLKIRASKEEKELFSEILDNFPALQVNFSKDSADTQSFYFSQSRGVSSLEDFIMQECAAFSARVVRSGPRKKIHLNAILTKIDPPNDTASEKTITMDISPGGCFLFSTQSWDMNEKAAVILKELRDQTPIICEIRWTQTWGESMRVPGIGVRFARIEETQLKEIAALL